MALAFPNLALSEGKAQDAIEILRDLVARPLPAGAVDGEAKVNLADASDIAGDFPDAATLLQELAQEADGGAQVFGLPVTVA